MWMCLSLSFLSVGVDCVVHLPLLSCCRLPDAFVTIRAETTSPHVAAEHREMHFHSGVVSDSKSPVWDEAYDMTCTRLDLETMRITCGCSQHPVSTHARDTQTVCLCPCVGLFACIWSHFPAMTVSVYRVWSMFIGLSPILVSPSLWCSCSLSSVSLSTSLFPRLASEDSPLSTSPRCCLGPRARTATAWIYPAPTDLERSRRVSVPGTVTFANPMVCAQCCRHDIFVYT